LRVDEHFPVVDVFTEQPMYVFQRHDQNVSDKGEDFYRSFEEFAHPQRVLRHFGLDKSAGAPSNEGDLPTALTEFARSGIGVVREVGSTLRAIPAVSGMRTRFQRVRRASGGGYVEPDETEPVQTVDS
jgi:hypothetical protein